MQSLIFSFRVRRSILRKAGAAAGLATAIAAAPGAFAQENPTSWRGLIMEKYYQIPVELKYQNGAPVVAYGQPYSCKVFGSLPAIIGPGRSVRSYTLDANGGPCSSMFSGRLEITEGASPSGYLLMRTFDRRGAMVHELRLAPQPN